MRSLAGSSPARSPEPPEASKCTWTWDRSVSGITSPEGAHSPTTRIMPASNCQAAHCLAHHSRTSILSHVPTLPVPCRSPPRRAYRACPRHLFPPPYPAPSRCPLCRTPARLLRVHVCHVRHAVRQGPA